MRFGGTRARSASILPARAVRGLAPAPIVLVLLFAAFSGALPQRSGATTANDLCAPIADPCVVQSNLAVDPGSVLDIGDRALLVRGNGKLRAGPGGLTIRAKDLTLEKGGLIGARGDRTTAAGTIVIEATSITINGAVDASGAEGGSVDLRAGARNGGAITISSTGRIRTDATVAGGDGGDATLSTTGLAGETGDITIDGRITAAGAGGSEDTGGGSGGVLTITAGGDIRQAGSGLALDVSGGSPDGSGGSISIWTAVGSVELTRDVDAHAPGVDSSGGNVDITAVFDVTIRGGIDASGGGFDGGQITIESFIGNVVFADTSSATVFARQGGDAGTITLTAGSFIPVSRADLVIDGQMKADGANAVSDLDGAAGGTFELQATDEIQIGGLVRANGGSGGGEVFAGDGGVVNITARRGAVSVTGNTSVDGGRGGGNAGEINISTPAGSSRIPVDGSLSASGGSGEGFGGEITIDAGGGFNLGGRVEALGPDGLGGDFTVTAVDPIEIDGTATVSGTKSAPGGTIDLSSNATITVRGDLLADTGNQVTGSGGDIDLEACAVRIEAGSSLRALRGRGVTLIRGHDSIFVAGSLRSVIENALVVRDAGKNLEIAPAALIDPPAKITIQPGLLPCPVCANGITEAPETCDDGNQVPGDGCDATCQLEATPTQTPSPLPPSPTATRTPTRGRATVTPTPTFTPTPVPPPPCTGDCGSDGQVTVDELIRGVRIALGDTSLAACAAFDANSDKGVTIDELVRGVRNALDGCPLPPTPTPHRSPTLTPAPGTCRLYHLTIGDGLPGPLTDCSQIGGTCLFISPDTGSIAINGTNGRFDPIPLPVEICDPGQDGRSLVRLAETVLVGTGLPAPAVGRICSRVEPDTEAGFLACDGGDNVDVSLEIDSNGTGPTGQSTTTVGAGSAASGTGSMVVRVFLQTVIVEGDANADCAEQDYSAKPRQRTAFTTGTARTTVRNARHRLSDPVTGTAILSGAPIDCMRLNTTQRITVAAPTYTLDVEIPVLGGVADFAQVLRIDGPLTPVTNARTTDE